MSEATKNIQFLTSHDRAEIATKESELQSRGFMYVDDATGEDLLPFEYTITEEGPATIFDTQSSYTLRWREE